MDYSKWDHIEVSDDEDDTHPNIDTPSLFKWRHEARVQRMEEMKGKTDAVDAEKKRVAAKLKEVQDRVKKEEQKGGDNLTELKKSLTEVEKAAKEVDRKRRELDDEKNKQPKNVDTLSRDGFSKTILNTATKPKEEDLTEEEREKKMKKFVKDNQKLIKEYGMIKKFDDSKKFLMEGNTHLASEETANYLVIWCLDLEMEGRNLLKNISSNNNYFLIFLRQARVDVPRGSPVHLHAVSAGAGQAVGVHVRPQGLHLLLLHPENPLSWIKRTILEVAIPAHKITWLRYLF